MPGTDSNSGRCSLLYHSLNSCTCWASISTYTMKIPRPFCAMCPSPLCSVAAIVLPRLVGTRSSRLEPRRDRRHQLGSHLSFKVHFTPRLQVRHGLPVRLSPNFQASTAALGATLLLARASAKGRSPPDSAVRCPDPE